MRPELIGRKVMSNYDGEVILTDIRSECDAEVRLPNGRHTRTHPHHIWIDGRRLSDILSEER